MYVKIYRQGYVLCEKGALDSYNPPYFTSLNYKQWVSLLGPRTCLFCVAQHGKVYGINDSPNPQPPVHQKCKCQIQPLNAIKAGDTTKDGQNGADWYLKNKGQLPSYYIDDIGLSKLGWRPGDKPSKYAPGKMYTKGVYDNSDKHLPDKTGRVWYEADINYTPGKRNKHRVLWSNDGLIFVTYDHYITFYEIV